MVDFEGYDGFTIKSPEMISVFKTVYDFACQGKPVILFGPSGAGKEFLSRYYFAHYKKATHCKGGFHSLNCAGLSEEFAMSDLFGHMKGAFTSAHRSRDGLFKMAQDGVLFLDEVGDLSESVQAILLRAMDENTREVRSLGDDISYIIRDTTIISATEKSSDSLRDSFRYRLGQPIQVPGLDDRPEDVEEALKFFCFRAINGRLDRVKLLSSLLQRNASEINSKTINDPQIVKLVEDIATHLAPLVKAREWPGNYRALRSAVDSGIIRARDQVSNSSFIEDVTKYFLHHLGDFSLSVVENMQAIPKQTNTRNLDEIGKWMDILSQEFPNMKEDEKTKTSSFLTAYENSPFKTELFRNYMVGFSARVAQQRIKKLIEKNILEMDENARHTYRVNSMSGVSDSQDFKLPLFMQLPETTKEVLLPEKVLEAIGIIENTRGLFISEDDPEKREIFLGNLGNRLKENDDVLFYSFRKNKLDDFVSDIIDHLINLHMDGWIKNEDRDKMAIEDKLIGISGYMNQLFLKHKKTIIILDSINNFNTSESQSTIDKLIFYWHPVQFIFGTKKQFVQQHYSNTIDFMELKL